MEIAIQKCWGILIRDENGIRPEVQAFVQDLLDSLESGFAELDEALYCRGLCYKAYPKQSYVFGIRLGSYSVDCWGLQCFLRDKNKPLSDHEKSLIEGWERPALEISESLLKKHGLEFGVCYIVGM